MSYRRCAVPAARCEAGSPSQAHPDAAVVTKWLRFGGSSESRGALPRKTLRVSGARTAMRGGVMTLRVPFGACAQRAHDIVQCAVGLLEIV